MTELPPCPVCTRGASLRFVARGHRVFRCGACDFEFVSPVPDQNQLSALYDRGYFDGSGLGYSDYFGSERDVSEQKSAVRIAALQALDTPPRGAWLDVGCADGRFIAAALAHGYRARGVEVSLDAREHMAPDVRSLVDDSLDAARAHGPFDVVTLWDVLEHLAEPLAALRTIRGMLAGNGLLAVVLPVIDNVNARIAPRWWDQYKPPEHLWYFSRASLCQTLCAETGGTVVCDVPAWTRAARLFDVVLPARGALGRVAKGLDASIGSALRRFGVLTDEHFVDSRLVIVRAPSNPFPARTNAR